MTQSGIMAEIRTLLAQDKSPKEVISLGYKPSTVYRAPARFASTEPAAISGNGSGGGKQQYGTPGHRGAEGREDPASAAAGDCRSSDDGAGLHAGGIGPDKGSNRGIAGRSQPGPGPL